MGTRDKAWPYPIRSDPDGRPYVGEIYIFHDNESYHKGFNLDFNEEEFIGSKPIVASKDLVEW